MERVGVRVLCGVGTCLCVLWRGLVFECCLEWVEAGVRLLYEMGRCSCIVWNG